MDYVDAERRAILDMQATGKPYLVIVNSRDPRSEDARRVCDYLEKEYHTDPIVADCQGLNEEDICHILHKVLYAFPLQELRVHLPRWMDALEFSHPVKAALYEALMQRAQEIGTLAQAQVTLPKLRELEDVLDFSIRNVDLGKGAVSCAITFTEKLFYEILSSKAGMPIENDGKLISLLSEFATIKQEYDKISDALNAVKATGYGIVMPTAEEMTLQTPEILRKGGSFGVKLKAGAPSIHMIRVDIDTEISPMVGDEKQSQDLISYLAGEDPDKLWQSNIFGKSVYALIQEGLTTKLVQTPEDVRERFRGTLTRIVNEGATGLICLIL
jgi:stage IV sporulation protein A